MAKKIKKKTSFGTAGVNHFSPAPTDGWPKAINIHLNLEEALKLRRGLGQIPQHINTYNRSSEK